MRRTGANQRIGACVLVLLALVANGCSLVPKCTTCVMPAGDHSYGPLTPFGFYETHWNVWPTETEDEYAPAAEELPPPEGGTTPPTTTPTPSGEGPSQPGGEATEEPLLPPPTTQPSPLLPDSSTPLPSTPSPIPVPGGPETPESAPSKPADELPNVLPVPSTPGDKPAEGAGVPESTLPPLSNPGDLKPGDLLPENLLPKDDGAKKPPQTDEKKKSTPTEPGKQGRIRPGDRLGPQLSGADGNATPELEFPRSGVRKASGAEPSSARPAVGVDGWRAKGGGAVKPSADSDAAWQGRRSSASSANRQASHQQTIDHPEPVQPAGGAGATGNPLR